MICLYKIYKETIKDKTKILYLKIVNYTRRFKEEKKQL